MVKIYESTQIIRRIMHLAKDEPSTAIKSQAETQIEIADQDQFEPAQATKSHS